MTLPTLSLHEEAPQELYKSSSPIQDCAVIHFSQYQKHVSHLLNQHTQHSHKERNWFLSFLHYYYDEIAQMAGQKYFICVFFSVLRKLFVNTYFCRGVKRQ